MKFSLEGSKIKPLLMVLSPVPIMFVELGSSFLSNWTFTTVSILISLGIFFLSTTIGSKEGKLNKLAGYILSVSFYVLHLERIVKDPFYTLLFTSILILLIYIFIQSRWVIDKDEDVESHSLSSTARYGAISLIIPLMIYIFAELEVVYYSVIPLIVSLFLTVSIYNAWLISKGLKRVNYITLTLLSTLLFFLVYLPKLIIVTIVISVIIIILLSLQLKNKDVGKAEFWWNLFIDNPERILSLTFLFLSVFGAILLILPISTKNPIGLVDALFISTSGVCVTGLSTMSIADNFTFWGQLFLLLLIQLGGIGIMGVTIILFHKLGQRLSLKQEYIIKSINDTDHDKIITSLSTILKVTFTAEIFGAAFLFIMFLTKSGDLTDSIWKAIFTSVSAFCNAGFALDSDSLINYNSNPFILHTVSILIVLGGLAPATTLVIPRWLRGYHISISSRISLIVTAILLVSGAFFITIFEWRGILENLPLFDKFSNGVALSVTLRTAGFNSVDISSLSNPTLIIMIIYMFIGGSPGSTAGGIKTTTIGIIAITFWKTIRNRNALTLFNREIHHTTVYRAISIFIAGFLIWFFAIFMLETTQDIPLKLIIFEATSALATVGLSIGCTDMLDEIGKIIIIFSMFIGRIGPITLFAFFNISNKENSRETLRAKISLT
ncbi:MAG: potassium transporter TrkH [Candidatus Cloacimonadota bacterium]|nr:MAG: potassium transporter TrkH [Candidatus Cloacimonadota bacterium]PIE79340.1 MAG: potassium transporter TrkH [Candidatus Delongbacteria bacterium]